MILTAGYTTTVGAEPGVDEPNLLFNFPDICLDAKILFDDNAEFRQKNVFGLRDRTQEDKNEVEAAIHNLVSLFCHYRSSRLLKPQSTV